MSEINKDQRIESLEEKVTHLSRMLVTSFGYADQDPDTFLQNARRTTSHRTIMVTEDLIWSDGFPGRTRVPCMRCRSGR